MKRRIHFFIVLFPLFSTAQLQGTKGKLSGALMNAVGKHVQRIKTKAHEMQPVLLLRNGKCMLAGTSG